MANILDPMDLKQIITLHLDGASNRRIGSILGISRNTVNAYMQLFSSHTTVDTGRHNELMLYFEGVNKARNHPGFTFLHHYQQYVEQAPANQEKPLRMKRALGQYPEIASVSVGDPPIDDLLGHATFFLQRDTGIIEVLSGAKYIDGDYLETFGMEVLAGANIDLSKGTPGYILNNAAVSAFGFASADAAVGKMLISGSGTDPVPIAGVVADFHQQDFRNPMSPVVLMFGYHVQRDIHIKLATANPAGWHNAMTKIEKAWKEIYPEAPFEVNFYDEVVAALYTKERQTSTLVNAATGITIFISCLGLFGSATLTAFQRTKEIGIRKVLGASVSGIVSMLSVDFIKLVLIASVIASPIAWWAMNSWLQDFAYRIDIQWWMFAVAGLAAVAIALLTVSWQAIRAALANPVDSLRDE